MRRFLSLVVIFVGTSLFLGCFGWKKEVVEEKVPYEVMWVEDPEMYDFEETLTQAGKEGLARVVYRVREKDGEIVERQELDRKIIKPSIPEIRAKGTKKVGGVILVLISRKGLPTFFCPWKKREGGLAYESIRGMIHSCADGTTIEASPDILKKYLGKLVEIEPRLIDRDGWTGYSSFLCWMPTINFRWKPVGPHKLVPDEWGRVRLAPEIVIPEEIPHNDYFKTEVFLPFDLGGAEGIPIRDKTAENKLYICRNDGDKLTVLNSRELYSRNVAISPDEKKIAFLCRDGVYVYDSTTSQKEYLISMPYYGSEFYPMSKEGEVGFNPFSDLVVFTWEGDIEKLPTIEGHRSLTSAFHLYIGSWLSGSSKRIMPEVELVPHELYPIFWLAE